MKKRSETLRLTGDIIFDDFGDLPIVEKGWMKNNTLFKIETPKTGKRQVNIGLGRDGEGMRIFNENIINFEIVK